MYQYIFENHQMS